MILLPSIIKKLVCTKLYVFVSFTLPETVLIVTGIHQQQYHKTSYQALIYGRCLSFGCIDSNVWRIIIIDLGTFFSNSSFTLVSQDLPFFKGCWISKALVTFFNLFSKHSDEISSPTCFKICYPIAFWRNQVPKHYRRVIWKCIEMFFIMSCWFRPLLCLASSHKPCGRSLPVGCEGHWGGCEGW